MNAPPFPIRTECPPGSCVCQRDALMQASGGDTRILRLTREEEKRLVQRLEQITSLADLRHMEQRLFEQLGVRLTIGTGSQRGAQPARHHHPGARAAGPVPQDAPGHPRGHQEKHGDAVGDCF